MLLPPAYRAKDVKESDHISEIGLVIADEQYILFRKPVQALHTVYLQLIDDRESRERKCSDDGIYQTLNQPRLFYSLKKG